MQQYYKIEFVCQRPDGTIEAPHMVQQVCRNLRQKIEGLENFHSHMLRHTYTSNLLAAGAPPVVVQELLGHTEIGTTLGTYAHAANDARRQSVKLLDGLGQ